MFRVLGADDFDLNPSLQGSYCGLGDDLMGVWLRMVKFGVRCLACHLGDGELGRIKEHNRHGDMPRQAYPQG